VKQLAALAACVLRETTKKAHQLFEEKSAYGDPWLEVQLWAVNYNDGCSALLIMISAVRTRNFENYLGD